MNIRISLKALSWVGVSVGLLTVSSAFAGEASPSVSATSTKSGPASTASNMASNRPSTKPSVASGKSITPQLSKSAAPSTAQTVAINDDILVQSVSNAVTNASLSSIDYSHRPSIISATFSGINYDTRSLANFTNMNSIEASQLLTSGLQRIGYAKPGKILFMDSSWTSQPSVAAVHSAQSNSVMYIQNIGPIVFSANQAGISVICQQSQIYLFGFERTSPASAKIAVTIGNCDFGSIQPLGF